MIPEITFIIAVIGILHTYLLYPWITNYKAKNHSQNNIVYDINDENLPYVSIIFAAHNEEKVIEQKIISTFNSNYPNYKIELIIGTDNCSDNTENIIAKYKSKYKINHLTFIKRQGKASIINQLVETAQNSIIILSDANVFFDEQTIYQLVKHYKNLNIGLVGGNILNNKNKTSKGIISQEKYYLYKENLLKYQEGIIWGSMIGSFGGCYSIRKELFIEIPNNKLLADDFFITINILKQNFKAINELNAIAFEDLNESIWEEFRRKKRISAGTFPIIIQNFKMWILPFNGLSFAFCSHKVLRYITPILVIIAFISNIIIFEQNIVYKLTLLSQIILYTIPVIDAILSYLKINIKPMRFISHFILMNMALLIGIIKSIISKGNPNWKPSNRNICI